MNSATGSQSYACGVSAFREGNFSFAIDCFRVSLDKNPSDWNAKFFLAMALAQGNHTQIAEMHFRSISELCPDSTLRARAQAASHALRILRY